MTQQRTDALGAAQDHWRRGEFDESRTAYQAVLEKDPGCVDAMVQLGHLEREQGRLESAEALHRRATESGGDAVSFTALGRTLSDSGQGTPAANAFLAAIQADETYAPAYQHLGELYGAIGQIEHAHECFLAAAKLDPSDPFARHNLGISAQLAGKTEVAIAQFRAALELSPDYWRSCQALGDLYRSSGEFTPALHCYQKLITLQPNSDNLMRLGATLQLLAQYDDAIAAYDHILELAPDNQDALYNLGTCYQALGDLDRAEKFFKNVLDRQPHDIRTLAAVASLHDRRGDYDKGLTLLLPLIKTAGENAELWTSLGKLARNAKRPDEVLPGIELALKNENFSRLDRSRISFIAGLLRDTAGDYDRAFQHFHNANRLKARTYDQREFEDSVTQLINLFDKALIDRLREKASSDSRPVFVVGMPRSGSTLLEQILDSHPDVASIGETALLSQVAFGLGSEDQPYPDCLSSSTTENMQMAASLYLAGLPAGYRRVVDKMLSNLVHAGLIAALFPNARMIHCVRHPLDTLLSCYSHDFTGNNLGFSYDFDDLTHYYRQYRRLMDHWSKIDALDTNLVHYEEVVSDTETTIRSTLDF
ncbi:MAG: sulfotransferase, partial [Gammaproteobacteria bacterium]|nr:sulfotransferase [Gammaproteobacteria bacterium]